MWVGSLTVGPASPLRRAGAAWRQSRHLSALGSPPPPPQSMDEGVVQPRVPASRANTAGASRSQDWLSAGPRVHLGFCIPPPESQVPNLISDPSYPISGLGNRFPSLILGLCSLPSCPLCTPTLGRGALTPASARPAPASGQTAAPVVAVISQGCSDTN